ncbi:inosine/xanthosine triphosphatase [Opitutales bacterium ASA1]|nr:inosine/xanthosine triphosphatase [Opitutales bacterium ASA1]
MASANPVKIAATRLGFERMFGPEATARYEFSGVSVPSGVSHQPMDDVETLHGAESRARNARAAEPEADYWVGLEGGVEDREGVLHGFAWIVVLAGMREGRSRTASFEIPPAIAALVRQGVELGHADDQVFGRTNSKQGNGAVGLLTADVIDRVALYEPAVVLALIPFRNPTLYPARGDET